MDVQTRLSDFRLDIFAQQPRINKLYTQITFCFLLPDDKTQEVLERLSTGLQRLYSSFPWVAGLVVCEDDVFRVKPADQPASLVVKDLRTDEFATWEVLQRAAFPFRMLDETIVAPRKTLVTDQEENSLPVFVVQADMVRGGLLLTINGHHGSMDMAGQAQVMSLFAKACRGETFTAEEISIGNMDRAGAVQLLEVEEVPAKGNDPAPAHALPSPSKLEWAYFTFAADSLASLKARAQEDVPPGSWISTDDALSAFVWQAVTRARLSRTSCAPTLSSTLSRNVDARRALSLPPTYTGLITAVVTTTREIGALIDEPVGAVALRLRSELDYGKLAHSMRVQATQIAHKLDAKATAGDPALVVRLSSWAKERCYDLDFGFGKPAAVRRPSFAAGTREGLVYFLPKTLDGEIMVGICLGEEDMGRLREDRDFGKSEQYIG